MYYLLSAVITQTPIQKGKGNTCKIYSNVQTVWPQSFVKKLPSIQNLDKCETYFLTAPRINEINFLINNVSQI